MRCFSILTILLSLTLPNIHAVDPPGILNYQGTIEVDDLPFDGTGNFLFALVDSGGSVLWSNDGEDPPVATVPVAVTLGRYSVPLGDTSFHAAMDHAIPASIFTGYADVRLRVWFDADGGGSTYPLEQLTPDQRLASVGYALSAASAETASGVTDGSITSAKLADDAVIAGKIADGAVTKLDSPDGSLIGVVRADSFGRVGIGPNDPLGNHTPTLTALDSIAADFTFSSPDIVVVGDYAYAALGTGSSTARLQVFDISDPENIVALDYYSDFLFIGPYGLDVQGDFAYVADYNRPSLKVFNVSDPNAITLAGEFVMAPLTDPRALDVQGNYAYVGAQIDSAELQIYDISDPSNIILTDSTDISDTRLDRVYDLVVRDDFVYVIDGYTKSFSIFDVSDPNNLVERGWVNTGFSIPESIALQGDRAYIVDSGTDDLKVFNVSDPNNIVLLGSVSTTLDAPRSVAVQGAYAFIAQEDTFNPPALLEIIDISDPTAMTSVLTESTNLSSPYSLTVSGDKIYLGDGTNDFLQIYELTTGEIFLGGTMVLPAEKGVLFDDKLQSKAFGKNSVTTEEIVDFGVTVSDIGIDAVTRQKLADGAVGTDELGDAVVTLGKFSPTYYDSQADPLGDLTFSGSTATLNVSYDTPFPIGEFPEVSVPDGWTVTSGNSTTGFTATSSFSIFTVDSSADVGEHSSLALVDGRPAIAYYDRDTDDLKYAIAPNADGSGTWTSVVVDATGDVGKFCSLTISPINGFPIISYFDDSDPSNGTLKYAYGIGDGTGGWATVFVDPVSDSGEDTSIAWVDGRPAISYYGNFDGALKFAIADEETGTADWTIYTVDTVDDVGRDTSLAVVAGRPAIGYLDATNNDLKYALATTVDGSGSWTTVTVDSIGNVGYNTSLAIVNGYPAISYQDLGNKDLKFAIADNQDGLGTWTTVIVDAIGDTGYDTSLALVDNKPAISYFDDTADDLKYAISSNAFGTSSWSSVTVDETDFVGEYSSLAVIDGRASISYYDVTADSLNYAVLPPTPVWSSSRGVSHPLYVNAALSAQTADFALFAKQVAERVITPTSFVEDAVDNFALANNAVSTLNIVDGSISNSDLASDIASGLWDASGGDVYRSAGKVGIGTASPQKELHIHADASNGPDIFLTDTDTGEVAGSDGIQLGMDSNEDGFFWNYESDKDIYIGAGNAEVMRAASTGEVGIGGSPVASGDRLQVFGDLTIKDPSIVGFSRINFSDNGGVNASIEGNVENGGSLEFEADYSAFTGSVGINGSPALGGDALQVFGDIECVALTITSDRNKKDGFETVDPQEVLDKVAAMPITRWHYKSNTDVAHLGPMAQDFHAAFGVGKDDKHITTVDADGVALAAIQGLKKMIDQKNEQIGELEGRIQRLESLLTNLIDTQ